MTDTPNRAPPPHVAAAAAIVEGYLKGQAPTGKVSDEQFAKMPARERIDYARQFDQTQFNPPEKRR